jgi:hypothetical protein
MPPPAAASHRGEKWELSSLYTDITEQRDSLTCGHRNWSEDMKRLVLLLSISLALALVAPAAEAALRFIVIDGTNGTIVSSDLAANDRPAVTRISQGFYRLIFRFNIAVFTGHAQRPGGGGDATALIFTSTYDPNKPREIHVKTLGVASGQPVLSPMDGRITIIVNR